MLIIKNRAGKRPVLLLILAVALQSGCTPPGPRALMDGTDLLEQGRYPEAVDRLKEATSLLSTNAQAWNYLGLAYHHAGQLTDAAQAYQKALALDYDLAEVHYNLGCLWLEQNRFEAARTELTSYTSLRKNSTDGWLKLGVVYLSSVRTELHGFRPAGPSARLPELGAAEKSFGEALRVSPRNVEALNDLGMVELCRNHPRDAAQHFREAMGQQPDYAPALLNLAVASQVYLNDPRFALEKYREYLALPAHQPDAQICEAAARELESELNLPQRPVGTNLPEKSSPGIKAAGPGIGAGDRAAASAGNKSTTNVSTLPPPSRERKATVAKLNAESPQITSPNSSPVTQPELIPSGNSAATESSLSTTQKPGFFARMNPLKWFHSGSETNGKSGSLQTNGSSPSVEIPGDLSPGLPRYPYRSPTKPTVGDEVAGNKAFNRGWQAQQAKHLSAAIQLYVRAAQLNPADFDAFYNLGSAAAAAGNLPQSLVAYEYALAIRPGSSDARYNFALALKQAKYPVDAADQLARLLSFYPDETRAHLALGNLFAQQLHRPALAREHYEKVLSADPRNSQAAAIQSWLARNPP